MSEQNADYRNQTPRRPRGPTRLLNFKELKSTRGIHFSRTHLARMEVENKFPKRVALGTNRVGWVETEIDEWLAAKLAARG